MEETTDTNGLHVEERTETGSSSWGLRWRATHETGRLGVCHAQKAPEWRCPVFNLGSVHLSDA